MAKKQMISVPFHQVHVKVDGSAVQLTFQKRVKGGVLALGRCVIDRKDDAPGRQEFVDMHGLLATWE